jgi:hypothetical protein
VFSCFCQKWLIFYDNKIYYIILFVYIIYPRVERSRIVMNWMRVEMFLYKYCHKYTVIYSNIIMSYYPYPPTKKGIHVSHRDLTVASNLWRKMYLFCTHKYQLVVQISNTMCISRSCCLKTFEYDCCTCTPKYSQ